MLESVERLYVRPTQLMQIIVAMIDKPKGGLRPVALFTSMLRVWGRARRPAADEWRRNNDRGYVIFGAGESPEQAIWRQAVVAKQAGNRVGSCAASSFYDWRRGGEFNRERFFAWFGVPVGCIFADLWVVVHAAPTLGVVSMKFPRHIRLKMWVDGLAVQGTHDWSAPRLGRDMVAAVRLLADAVE